jgi:hypothetical protein
VRAGEASVYVRECGLSNPAIRSLRGAVGPPSSRPGDGTGNRLCSTTGFARGATATAQPMLKQPTPDVVGNWPRRDDGERLELFGCQGHQCGCSMSGSPGLWLHLWLRHDPPTIERRTRDADVAHLTQSRFLSLFPHDETTQPPVRCFSLRNQYLFRRGYGPRDWRAN